MSAINGINYQNALTILNQSSENTAAGSSSGTTGLVSAAEQVGANSNVNTSAGAPTDTISLSDQAKSALAAAANATASNNPAAASPASQSATDGSAALNAEIQLLQQQAAAEGGTATVQNASDVPGLDFQENVQQSSKGTQVSLNYNSQVAHLIPNSYIVFDSNPADAKFVTV
ncbi:MAG: hypothetical protein WCC64_00465 [Aliidongia sp.]